MNVATEREIFKFHVGEKQRGVDPIKVHRILSGEFDMAHEVQALIMYQNLVSRKAALLKKLEKEKNLDTIPEPTGVEKQVEAKGLVAFDKIVQATRKAFGVGEFEIDDNENESGMVEAEVLELFFTFLVWGSTVKKNTKPKQT